MFYNSATTMPDFSLTINDAEHSIWRYGRYYPQQPRVLLSLGEGDTPLKQWQGLLLKREDANPTGSAKDRSFAYHLSCVQDSAIQGCVISSSGNAAISAAAYARAAGIPLMVFISPRTEQAKQDSLVTTGASVVVSEHPLADSLRFSQEQGFTHLRQSTSADAVPGYTSLAFELYESVGDALSNAALCIPVSSGTLCEGLFLGLHRLVQDGFLSRIPQFHIAQTAAIHPLAEQLGAEVPAGGIPERSVARSICAVRTARADAVLAAVHQTGGRGWIFSDEDILRVHQELVTSGIHTSYESALAVAVGQQVSEQNSVAPIIPLLTGRWYGKDLL